jgi:hypothetical protein
MLEHVDPTFGSVVILIWIRILPPFDADDPRRVLLAGPRIKPDLVVSLGVAAQPELHYQAALGHTHDQALLFEIDKNILDDLRFHEETGLCAIIQGGKRRLKHESLAQSIDQVLAIRLVGLLRLRLDL